MSQVIAALGAVSVPAIVAGGGGNAFITLFNTKNPSPDQWFRLDTGDAFGSGAEARTRDKFDGGLALSITPNWDDDADVEAPPTADGVGPLATSTRSSATAYTKPIINQVTGDVAYPPQGHDDDRSNEIAALIAGSVNWTVINKPGRILRYDDGGKATHKPAWSTQILAVTPSSNSWMILETADGGYAFTPSHAYASDFFGLDGSIYVSGTAGMGSSGTGGSFIGACFKVTFPAGVVSVHYHNTDSGSDGYTKAGLAKENSGNIEACGYDLDLDLFLTVTGNYALYKVEDASTSPSISRATVDGGIWMTNTPWSQELVVIPDPENGGDYAAVSIWSMNNTNEFTVIKALFGTTVTAYHAFANDPSALMARAPSPYDSVCKNGYQNKIVYSQGDRKLYQVPDYTLAPSNWTMTELTTSPSGVGGDTDMPPDSQGQCRLEYLAEISLALEKHVYILATRGGAYCYYHEAM